MSVTIHHPRVGATERPNFSKVHINDVTIWFSYQTPIAVWGHDGLVVRENEWGPTTGKHLNYIDHGEKSTRVTSEEFYKALDEAVMPPTVVRATPADINAVIEIREMLNEPLQL